MFLGKKVKIKSNSEQNVFILMASNVIYLTETKTQHIFKQIESLEPDILVIDSIQTLQSDFIEASAGSVSQIKAMHF